MYPRLGLTRNVLRRNYALITPDGYVKSTLPGWTKCAAFVIISAAMGARVTQMVIHLEEGGSGQGQTGRDEWFFYIISGRGTINGQPLVAGGFAFVPAGDSYTFASAEKDTRVLIFRKTYEPLAGVAEPAFFTGDEKNAPESPFLGDPRARLKTLLPDAPGTDMAVNLFTYDPGATLPFVETHIMEHGMLFLAGSGVYRLDEDWHPVQAGDSLWIAPYCPQWFIAAGPEPARYIYYKDVNRMPL
jgi:(S)-ureidoglycine aminohydrolase